MKRKNLILISVLSLLVFSLLPLSNAQSPTWIACFGDSITAGTMIVTPYPNRLGTYLNTRVDNHGENGYETYQITEKWETVKTNNYTIIVYLGGVNDIINGVPLNQITGNISLVLSEALSSGRAVYLLEVLPFAKWDGWDLSKQLSLNALNFWIDYNSTDLGAVNVIHTYNLFNDGQDGLKSNYDFGDGLHLSDNGAQYLAEVIGNTIEPRPPTTPTAPSLFDSQFLGAIIIVIIISVVLGRR